MHFLKYWVTAKVLHCMITHGKSRFEDENLQMRYSCGWPSSGRWLGGLRAGKGTSWTKPPGCWQDPREWSWQVYAPWSFGGFYAPTENWKTYEYWPNLLIHLKFTRIKAVHCDLCGVDLSLDDVKDGDVAVARLPLSSSGHHHVLGLQKPPHHIQHCGFPDTSNLKRRWVKDSTVNIFHSHPPILV